jgi:hypothetical protein
MAAQAFLPAAGRRSVLTCGVLPIRIGPVAGLAASLRAGRVGPVWIRPIARASARWFVGAVAPRAVRLTLTVPPHTIPALEPLSFVHAGACPVAGSARSLPSFGEHVAPGWAPRFFSVASRQDQRRGQCQEQAGNSMRLVHRTLLCARRVRCVRPVRPVPCAENVPRPQRRHYVSAPILGGDRLSLWVTLPRRTISAGSSSARILLFLRWKGMR